MISRRKPAPPELCETCGRVATDFKLDGLADPHYFCPAHASPPREPEQDPRQQIIYDALEAMT